MKRITIIGFSLTSVLLLSTPIVPAIRLNALKDENQSIISDKTTKFSPQNLTDVVKTKLNAKHLLLFLIVQSITIFRFSRILFLGSISLDYPPNWRWPFPNIVHPLLYLRALMLFCTTDVWCEFWYDVSSTLGWNWYS